MAHCESRPPITEVIAIDKMLKFGKETGCPIELVHVSTCEAMELAKQAKLAGQKVFVETCPHYLLLTEEDVDHILQPSVSGGVKHTPAVDGEGKADPGMGHMCLTGLLTLLVLTIVLSWLKKKREARRISLQLRPASPV